MQKKNVYGLLRVFCLWVIPFVVVASFGTWYLFQRIKQEKIALEDKKTYNEETLKQLESFEKIKESLEEIKQTKELFEKTLMNSGLTLDLIKELEEGASYTGVELKTGVGEKPQVKKVGVKNLEPKTEDKKNEEVWLRLEVSGNFFNILKFIRYVENSNRTIALATLNLSKAKQLTPADLIAGEAGMEAGEEMKAIILISNSL